MQLKIKRNRFLFNEINKFTLRLIKLYWLLIIFITSKLGYEHIDKIRVHNQRFFPILILNDLCLHLHVHNRRKLMLIYQPKSKRGKIHFSKDRSLLKPEIDQIHLWLLIFV